MGRLASASLMKRIKRFRVRETASCFLAIIRAADRSRSSSQHHSHQARFSPKHARNPATTQQRTPCRDSCKNSVRPLHGLVYSVGTCSITWVPVLWVCDPCSGHSRKTHADDGRRRYVPSRPGGCEEEAASFGQNRCSWRFPSILESRWGLYTCDVFTACTF